MKTPRLAFGENIGGCALRFHSGYNTTIRLGGKWMTLWLKAGEQPFPVVLLDQDGRKIGTGVVHRVDYTRLCDIDRFAHLLYHQGAWNIEDVIAQVQYAYASAKIDSRRSEVSPTDNVTVVYFTVDNQE